MCLSLSADDWVQTGIALICHIGDYENGVIKRLEATSLDEEDDRTRLIETLGANTAPVLLTYRDSPDLNALTEEVVKGAPLYDFVSPDKINHTVWRVPGVRLAEFFVNAFAQVPCAYIVDGHHLAASAVRVGRERRVKIPASNGDEPHNWFLCVLVPASQVEVTATGAAVGAPDTVEELMHIADAGKMLLPKTTQSEPKLRSGLFIHTL